MNSLVIYQALISVFPNLPPVFSRPQAHSSSLIEDPSPELTIFPTSGFPITKVDEPSHILKGHCHLLLIDLIPTVLQTPLMCHYGVLHHL